MANNGLEALNKMRKTRYDAVVMDIEMPILDGYLAMSKIKKDGIESGPIIAFTTHPKDYCLQAGFTDHLQKGSSREQLLSVLDQYIPA